MFRLLSKWRERFRGGLKLFIIEAAPKNFFGTPAIFNFKKRKITIYPKTRFSGLEDLSRFARASGDQNIILSLDSTLGTTIFGALSFARDNPAEPLSEAEADNIVAHAIRKFLDDERTIAARKMMCDPMDVAVLDHKIWEIFIDGRRVFSPLGLTGKTIALRLSGTLAPRFFVEELQDRFPIHAIKFISERGVSMARLVFEFFRHTESKPYIFGDVSADSTTFFNVSGDRIAYTDAFAWGYSAAVKAFSDNLPLDAPAIGYVNSIYNSGQYASKDFFKKMGRLAAGEYNIFLSGVKQALSRSSEQCLLLRVPTGLPAEVLAEKIKNAANKNTRISVIPPETFGARFGFDVYLKKGAVLDADHLSAHIIDYYIAPTEKFFNELAARRLRWLRK